MAEFRHYRAFVEIAVRGSFTASAQAPHVTQSTISEQIAGLEKGTGYPPLRSGPARGLPHQVRATAARIRPAIAPDGRFGCAGRDHSTRADRIMANPSLRATFGSLAVCSPKVTDVISLRNNTRTIPTHSRIRPNLQALNGILYVWSTAASRALPDELAHRLHASRARVFQQQEQLIGSSGPGPRRRFIPGCGAGGVLPPVAPGEGNDPHERL